MNALKRALMDSSLLTISYSYHMVKQVSWAAMHSQDFMLHPQSVGFISSQGSLVKVYQNCGG